jgi:hypothetical protein
MNEVAKVKYLVRRDNSSVYYFKRNVPPALRDVIGKDVWRKSLKTKNYEEAVHAVHLHTAETERQIAKRNRITLGEVTVADSAKPPSRMC